MSNGKHIERLRQLLDKQEWTEEERRWLLNFFDTTDHIELQQLMQEKFDKDSVINQPEAKAEHLLLLIHKSLDAGKRSGKLFYLKSWKQVMAAASIVLVLSMGAVAYIYNIPEKHTTIAAVSKPETPKDIAPGHDNAILTLSNGTTIMLV